MNNIESNTLDSRSTRTRVVFLDSPIVRTDPEVVGLERKRDAVWKNDRRNETVDSVAKAFTTQDLRLLQGHGLRDDHIFLYMPAPHMTAVLVESVEHGKELHCRLPDWDFFHCSHSSAQQTSGPNRLGDPRRMIVTLTYADKADCFAPDVLITAMGGNWVFDVPGFPSQDKKHALVVDFADDFDSQAEQASRSRIRAYRANHWDVTVPPGWDPEGWNHAARGKDDSRQC